MRRTLCPVDTTCTFFPKGQCNRPYKEKGACWVCGQEVRQELRAKIAGLEYNHACGLLGVVESAWRTTDGATVKIRSLPSETKVHNKSLPLEGERVRIIRELADE